MREAKHVLYIVSNVNTCGTVTDEVYFLYSYSMLQSITNMKPVR